MPSSHSAVVTSAATAYGLQRGLEDPVFGVLVVFACIVMYDAQGVRRAVGKQAEVINTLVVPELDRPCQPIDLGQVGAGESPPLPRAASGVQLAQEPQLAELAFVANSDDGVRDDVGDRLLANIPAAPAGVELAQEPKRAELAFMQAGEQPGPSARTSVLPRAPASPVADAGPHDDLSESSNGSPASLGTTMSSLPRWLVEEVRGKAFFKSAEEKPAMKQGLVEKQELSELEGWRHIPLKESVGHTKLEVLVGGCAGIALAMVLPQHEFFQQTRLLVSVATLRHRPHHSAEAIDVPRHNLHQTVPLVWQQRPHGCWIGSVLAASAAT
eukprot:SM000030S11362  [mRNA]  locus=s30:290448:295148:+ [translate_table: standard]